MSLKYIAKKAPIFNFLSLLILIGILLGSCGRANSGDSRVEVVQPNISGYICFVIKDAGGTSVGANCLKND